MKTHLTLPKFRYLFLLAIALSQTACGFHPVYGGMSSDGTPVAEELHQVAIDPIPDHSGQILRNDLIDRIYGKGRPSQPAYHFKVALRVAEEDLGTLPNSTTALAAFHAYGDYVLTDTKGTVLTKGTASSTASYDKLSSQYATLAAHDGAVERTLREVSEQLLARLNLYFAERPAPKP